MNDKTIHPNHEQQLHQKRILDALPEAEREYHAFLFRVGNVSFRYYMEQEAEPDEDDYSDLFQGLPPNIADVMKEKGFEECRGILPLRRHAAERNDSGLSEFMRENLNAEDFKKWKNIEV